MATTLSRTDTRIFILSEFAKKKKKENVIKVIRDTFKLTYFLSKGKQIKSK